jgi:hypothetical protein
MFPMEAINSLRGGRSEYGFESMGWKTSDSRSIAHSSNVATTGNCKSLDCGTTAAACFDNVTNDTV